MGKLLNAISSMQKLSVTQVAEESLRAIAPDIEQEQREQMLEGEASDNTLIGKYRSKSYALRKNSINPLPGLGNVDLTLFKDYTKAIRVIVQNGVIKTTSSDEKAEALEKKYGADHIYGLNPDHKRIIVNEKLRPVVFKKLKENIKL